MRKQEPEHFIYQAGHGQFSRWHNPWSLNQKKDTGGSWVPSFHEPSGGLGIRPHSPGLPWESWWGSLDPAPPTRRLVEFHPDSDTGVSVSPRCRGSESLFSMYLHRYSGDRGEAVMKVVGQTFL